MTVNTTVEPIRVDVRVAAAPERAFEAFTAEFGAWWPLDKYAIGEQPAEEVVLEPREGGRWFERAADGRECDWGRVVAWEPPTRLVLAWQISAAWSFDPDLLTEVEIRFEPDAGGTRVLLEHRGLERYGEDAAHVRGVYASEGGWPGLLALYAARVS